MRPKETDEMSKDDDGSCSQEAGSVVVTKVPKRDTRRRRSSLGSLAQWVRRNSAETEAPVVSDGILANEAAHRFQFR